MTQSAWSPLAAALAAVPGCTDSACCSGAVSGAASTARSAGRSTWQSCSQDWLMQSQKGKPSEPSAAYSLLCGNNAAWNAPAARLHRQCFISSLAARPWSAHLLRFRMPCNKDSRTLPGRFHECRVARWRATFHSHQCCGPSGLCCSHLSRAFMAGTLAWVPPAACYATTTGPSLLLQTPQPEWHLAPALC